MHCRLSILYCSDPVLYADCAKQQPGDLLQVLLNGRQREGQLPTNSWQLPSGGIKRRAAGAICPAAQRQHLA